MTKILMLSNGITPDHLGGLQRYVRELASNLALRGAEITVVARRRDPELPREEVADDGVRIVRFDGPQKNNTLYAALYPLAAALSAERAARRFDDHVLHSHFPLQGLPLALRRRRFVHTFHAPVYREIADERQGSYALPGPLEGALVRASRASEAWMLRSSARILTLSDFMRQEVAVLDARAAERVTLVAGGVDTERFRPGRPIDHPWAGEPGAFLIFTARRLVPRTGVTELVRAMPAILERMPQARLVVAGQGALRDEIARVIDALGLGERVLLAGRVSDDDLVGWYRAADLVVIPTQELEGFGLATAEALACGTPAVGTPAGATPEILEALSPRLVARDVSPRAIADVVADVATDTPFLESIASAARARIHGAMSWSAIAERHLEIYGDLAAA